MDFDPRDTSDWVGRDRGHDDDALSLGDADRVLRKSRRIMIVVTVTTIGLTASIASQ